jgi:hypothetical protein
MLLAAFVERWRGQEPRFRWEEFVRLYDPRALEMLLEKYNDERVIEGDDSAAGVKLFKTILRNRRNSVDGATTHGTESPSG